MKNLLASRKFHSFLGMAVSGVILVWLLMSQDWGKVMGVLWKVHLWPFIPATIIFFVHMFLRAWRWKYLLPKVEELSIPLLFDCLMIGNLSSFILPLRAGEFIRPYLLTRNTRMSFATTFTSIIVERFFDLSMVLLSFALMVVFVPGIPPLVYQGAFALGALAVAILLFLVVGAFLPFQVSRIACFVLRPFPESIRKRLEHFLEGLLSATSVVRDIRRLFTIIILSIAVWLAIYLCYQIFIALF